MKNDIPATNGMLKSVRNELKSDIATVSLQLKSLEQKMDARFTNQDAKFKSIDARFNSIDARFDKQDAKFKAIDARFTEQDAKFEDIKSDIQRVISLVEEQNSRSKIFMDGYSLLFESHKNLEKRVEKLEA